jgi:hypothetical protein
MLEKGKCSKYFHNALYMFGQLENEDSIVMVGQKFSVLLQTVPIHTVTAS